MIYLAALLIGLSLLGALATLAISLHGLWLWWQGRQQRLGRRLRIRRSQWLSDDLLHLELVHPWRLPLPRFAPGQFLTILAQPPGSRPMRRCYSLAAWHSRPWQYQLCIKREALGRMSQWLAEQAQPGRSLRILPPAGHFTLEPQHGPHLVLIAGGVGITPMRAMLHAWLKRPGGRCLTLLYGGRDQAALAYHQELLTLAAAHPEFDYRPALSRDSLAPSAWQGRLDRQRLSEIVTADSEVFICAGEALLKACLAHLSDLGLPDARVHWEAFGAAALGAGAGQFALDWQGETLDYNGQPSLLHALHEQGVELPADCWGGHCGSCRLGCKGEVEWRQQPALALPAGQILACCCIPKEPLQLVRL